MTWLTPLFLAAGLAVAGPILFHLWQRTPRGRRLFSSTMFLAASPPRITHRSRIENWPLLCVRALALIMLALAYSRPVWRTAAQVPRDDSAVPAVAILVDVSASMQRSNIWESLRSAVNARIEALPAETPLAVFAFDHQWQQVVPFTEGAASDSSVRRQVIRDALDAIKPGWGSTRLGQALSQTVQSLREFQTAQSPRQAAEIWLVSDGASGADFTGWDGIDWPASTRLEVITPTGPLGTNAGVQWITSRAPDGTIPLRVRISNAQHSSRDEFQLSWETADSDSVMVHVPAGQSRTILAPSRPPEQPETVPLLLRGDDHEFDNRLWAAVPRRPSMWVLYLGDDDPEDVTSPRFFLQQALAVTLDADVTLRSPADISAVDRPPEPPQLTVWTSANVEPPAWLRPIIEQGGGLLAVPPTAEDAQRMLAWQGWKCDRVVEAETKDFSLLSEIDFEDPLFTHFVESRFADFRSTHFWKHRRLELPKDFPGRVLARFDDGAPALVFQHHGVGRAWMLTSGWHPADSQLARSPKFVPLLQRFLQQSTDQPDDAARVTVGERLRFGLPRTDGELQVTLPDGTLKSLPNSEATFPEADRPGIYLATRGTETHSQAVQLAPQESKTDPLPTETLERFNKHAGSSSPQGKTGNTPEDQRPLQLAELERSQALWRWCLLAAGLLVIGETWLAARTSSELPAQTDNASTSNSP